MILWFNSEGWLQTDGVVQVFHKPTKRFWEGMHPLIYKEYDCRLQGIVTHYDALGSAERTVRGFTKDEHGASTHFVIDRNGDIYQLASIHDRTWHAAFKKDSHGNPLEWTENNGRMTMGNGHATSAPNQWFVGLDLSNWGPLTFKDSSLGVRGGLLTHVGSNFSGSFLELDGKYWEKYSSNATESYVELVLALVCTLGIKREMIYRHSDTSPTRKIDPGPAFPFEILLDQVFEELESLKKINSLVDNDRKGDKNEV